MSSEKEKLIQKGGNSDTQKNTIKLRHALIFPMILFYWAGSGMMTYVLEEWTQNKMKLEYFPSESIKGNFSACSETNHSDERYIHYETVQQQTAHWLLYNKIAYTVPSFGVILFMPSYSDVYGRKFIFVIAIAVGLLKDIGKALVIYMNASPLYVVFLYFIYGMSGSGYGNICAIFAYTADITQDKNQRVIGILIIEATFIANSLITGPLSGVLIEGIGLGFSYTAYICVLVELMALIVVFFVPETLEEDKRVPRRPIQQIIQRTFEFYFSKQFKGLRLSYIMLIVSFLAAIIGSGNRTSMETLYFLGQPFCWGPKFIGYFSLAQHASKGVIGIASVNILQRCLSHEVIAALSTLSLIVSYIIEAFAVTDLMIYMVPVAGIFSFLVIPMIRAIMSNMTPVDKQGSMFASIGLVEVMGSLLTGTLGNEVYAATVSFMNGFVFLMFAFVCFINFVLLVVYCLYVKSKTPKMDSKQKLLNGKIPDTYC